MPLAPHLFAVKRDDVSELRFRTLGASVWGACVHCEGLWSAGFEVFVRSV